MQKIIEIEEGRSVNFKASAFSPVMYNKLYLKDNAEVRDTKYYKTGFIYYFENVSEINPGFL